MKQPFLWIALGTFAGILSAIFWDPPSSYLWAGFVFILPWAWMFRDRPAFLPLLVVLVALLATLRTEGQRMRPADAVEHWAGDSLREDEAPFVFLEGVVDAEPEFRKRGKRVNLSFVLEATNLVHYPDDRREYVPVSGKVQVFLVQPEITGLRTKARVRLRGRLERPRPALNPGQFDYRDYLKRRDIHAVFRGYGSKAMRILDSPSGWDFFSWVQDLRREGERRLEQMLPERQSSVLKAMILGKKKDLDPVLRDAFMKTGTAHLLAISGLHMSLVAGTLYLALIIFRIPQRAAVSLALPAVIFYVFIAGAGLPVRRAGIMTAAAFLTVLLERPPYFLNGFLMAFCFILWWDPVALTDLSFQLSFASVFSLFWFLRVQTETWPIQRIFSRSLAVLLGTIPLGLYYFQILSPLSLVANALAIPVFHAALILGILTLFLGGIPFTGFLFTRITEWVVEAALRLVAVLASWQFGYFYLPPPSALSMALYYGGLLAWGAWHLRNRKPLPWAGRIALALILSAAILVYGYSRERLPLKITALSGGKNEIYHIALNRKSNWLINTGRSAPSDQGRWLVAPYLRHEGVKRLDGVLLTDFYRKHTGGLETLWNNFDIRYLVYSAGARLPFTTPFKVNRFPVRGGENFGSGAGRFEIVAVLEGQVCYAFYKEPWAFLFIPSWRPEWQTVIPGLEPSRHWGVFLPSVRGTADAAQIEFLNQVNRHLQPVFWMLPHSEGRLEAWAQQSGVPMYSAEGAGAIQFSLRGPDKNHGRENSSLTVQSFLPGVEGIH